MDGSENPSPWIENQKAIASSRGWWTALALIMMLGALLRVIGIDHNSFWYDEAYTAHVCQSGAVSMHHKMDNGNPPLHFVLLAQWAALFGDSEAAYRSFSVVFGVLTLLFIGLLGRRAFTPVVGLTAATLLAISPTGIELSNEARTYAMLSFLATVSTWLFLRWVEERRWTDLVCYGVAILLGMLSHYFAVAIPLAHLAALPFYPNPRRLLWPWALAMGIGAVIWSALWMGPFVDQLHTPGNIQRGGERWLTLFLATPVVCSLGRSFAWRDSSIWALGIALASSCIVFFGSALWGIWKNKGTPARVLLVAWFALPILGPLVVALLFAPIYQTRYASVGLPAFLLLVALGLQALRAPWRGLAISVMLALSCVSLYRYYTEPLKDDWRAATPDMLADPSDLIVLDQDIEAVPFLYYAAKNGIVPETLVGLYDDIGPTGRMRGVQFHNGTKAGGKVRELNELVFASPSVCLALCVPKNSPEQYQKLFHEQGYALAREEHLYRIQLYWFERKKQLAKTGGGAFQFTENRPDGTD